MPPEPVSLVFEESGQKYDHARRIREMAEE
jgi:hypothetical protein